MRRTIKKASSKPTGPCTLCGVKTASSWRRIPSTVPEAAGQSSCNACYVFVLKRHKDDEESVPLALEVCRASKRSRAAMLQAEDGDDADDEEEETEDEMGMGGLNLDSGSPGSSAATPTQAAAQQLASELSGELQALQQACWHVSHDPQAAHLAHGYAGQLPGPHPERLGALPAVWLLLPAGDRPPQPAGALLLSVQLPPRSLAADAQRVLLDTGAGLQTAMRVVVYCRYTGQVLQRRDWVQRDESCLYTHPRHQVPAWDSSEGWKLLFPETASDTAQARLFTGLVSQYGASVAAAAPPTFLVGGGGINHHGEGSSTSTAEPSSPQGQQAHQPWQTPMQQLQQQSPPPALQQQQQRQQAVWRHTLPLSEEHSSRGHMPPIADGPVPHGGQWGQQSLPAHWTAPQLHTPAAASFRQMLDSLDQPPQPHLQDMQQQQPQVQQPRLQDMQPQRQLQQPQPQQPQQQQPAQPQWQRPQQQALVPGSLAGGSGIFRTGSLEPLLVCPDVNRTGAFGDTRLAADLLTSTPMELLDEELLHWIVNLGSGTAPGGSLPFTP
ncbi:hypothetical protein C2E21_8578 isoform B [Chlorella sorokiniana]|uniref:GATA-type domain-containing protein n=1 Tax=Chlorella sorokiniana TaxID=3076 RepID=A0A2P6TDV3_CHLSO|nr:hypothetical protein C2E21_8578 isoform A [Chlorella sorokiniana]PRW20818.1 hypothetical protein C2E21_8578 isoform B [Chlorella sorokiniana]|eukprot:PRW20817.1 hypothetical protein C2E21_8578 isoform A [Chlorella sorokiniana]